MHSERDVRAITNVRYPEKSWTQKRAALALDVTQAYLSMLEKGHRPLSERLVSKALTVLNLPATALPLRTEEAAMSASWQKRDFSAELGALGYPWFAYLRARRRRNPAQVLLEALNERDLDAALLRGCRGWL
jgi:transcriptional regulator with XRE-family HTH domain